MALTRKFLAAMGIEEDKVDEIITAHTETVNGLKEQIETYKADAEKLPSVQKELDDAKKAMENGDKSPYKVKYDAAVEEKTALQAEFDAYKADVEAKATRAGKEQAYKALLQKAGVSEKRIDAVLRVSDAAINGVELDDKGEVKDAENLVKGIQTEWADFVVTEGVKGAETPTPPDNTPGKETPTNRAALRVAEYRKNLYGENKEG